MTTLHTKQYTKLELFAKSLDGQNGKILLTDQSKKIQEEYAGNSYYKWIHITLKKHSLYQIEVMDCEISQCYLSGNDNILDEGVCFLELGEEIRRIEGAELGVFYDTPYREQYHFNPYKNWINDPNGLCWFQGKYHLFYQSNPHEQKWGNMYWGHAASQDMVHWVHLPFVLEPQKELLKDPKHKGGAFSGCAVPLKDEVIFYLTRHYGPQQDGAGTKQWQDMIRSQDMISLTGEKEVIRQKPKGVGHDFRDPKVTRIGNTWYMVLAACLDGESAILLYESADMEHWKYTGPLVKEADRGSTTFECPDFYLLDGVYVAEAALMKHTDEYGRYQMTRCYLGNFSGNQLEVTSTQWFDFGSNYYAAQSFEHEGRRIAIGWVSDFYSEHRFADHGAYGSFSIPRELRVRNNRLYMKPVKEIYQLLDKTLHCGCMPAVLNEIPGNSYFVKIKLKGKSDFRLLLGQEGEKKLTFEVKEGIPQIRTCGVKSESIGFPADVEEVSDLEIFVDRRTAEIYINQGEAAGTKLFYTDSRIGIFISEFEKPEELEQIEVYTMKSIWRS